MGNNLGIHIYFRRPTFTDWPSLDIVWGESTHFVHDGGTHGDGEPGTPLNREWSISLWVPGMYAVIALNIDLPYVRKEVDEQ